MKTEYVNENGYRLVWSDGGVEDGLASEWLFDRRGGLLMHATVKGEKPTEEQMEKHIRSLLGYLGKKIDDRIMRGE